MVAVLLLTVSKYAHIEAIYCTADQVLSVLEHFSLLCMCHTGPHQYSSHDQHTDSSVLVRNTSCLQYCKVRSCLWKPKHWLLVPPLVSQSMPVEQHCCVKVLGGTVTLLLMLRISSTAAIAVTDGGVTTTTATTD